jgi:hypothetical protein
MRLWVSVVLCVMLGMAGAVHAQNAVDPGRAASARALFEEGVALSDKGSWPEATDRFRRALALRDSQVIRFNLAAALIEQGQVVEASELLRQVERDETAEQKLRDEAHGRLEDALAKVAKLTVHVDGALTGVTIALDQHPLDAAQLDVAIPADPGAHRVTATRDGAELASSDVTLAPGEAETVSLTLGVAQVATPAEAAQTVMATDSSPRRDQGEAPKSKKLMWWAIGGGAVVVVVAVVATVLATHKSDGGGSGDTYKGDFNPPSVGVQVGQ